MTQFIEKTLQRIDKLDRDRIRGIMQRLYHDHRRLEEVVNSLPEGIVVVDEQYRPIMSNRAARLLLPLRDRTGGRGAPNAAEAPATSAIWDTIDDTHIAEYLRQALGERSGNDSALFSLDIKGSVRTLQFTILPLVRGGKIVGNILRAVDITERLSKEARLYRAEQLASLTTLTANVAHEIKNPLAAISIYIQLIKREAQRESMERQAVTRYLTIVEEEIERLNATVVNFLFSVRPMALELEEADIHPLLEEIAILFEPEMREARIALTTRYAKNLPPIEIDRKYLKQALMNIIKNAMESIEAKEQDANNIQGAGGIKRTGMIKRADNIQGASGSIEIRTATTAQGIAIEIADDGIGIDNENLSNIFDPYFTTKDNGSGIGLTHAYKVIHEHRGEIAIANNRDAGATCTITLPLPRAQQKLIE